MSLTGGGGQSPSRRWRPAERCRRPFMTPELHRSTSRLGHLAVGDDDRHQFEREQALNRRAAIGPAAGRAGMRVRRAQDLDAERMDEIHAPDLPDGGLQRGFARSARGCRPASSRCHVRPVPVAACRRTDAGTLTCRRWASLLIVARATGGTQSRISACSVRCASAARQARSRNARSLNTSARARTGAADAGRLPAPAPAARTPATRGLPSGASNAIGRLQPDEGAARLARGRLMRPCGIAMPWPEPGRSRAFRARRGLPATVSRVEAGVRREQRAHRLEQPRLRVGTSRSSAMLAAGSSSAIWFIGGTSEWKRRAVLGRPRRVGRGGERSTPSHRPQLRRGLVDAPASERFDRRATRAGARTSFSFVASRPARSSLSAQAVDRRVHVGLDRFRSGCPCRARAGSPRPSVAACPPTAPTFTSITWSKCRVHAVELRRRRSARIAGVIVEVMAGEVQVHQTLLVVCMGWRSCVTAQARALPLRAPCAG